MADLLDQPRRSSRKREDKSYVECPDIVIEEDYLSKPSPAKKANLGDNPQPAKKPGQTNGIEMESDEDEDDEIFPPLPPPQVLDHHIITRILLVGNLSIVFSSST